jgi:predicted DNA-binding protein YlxM (UPF0122 family)
MATGKAIDWNTQPLGIVPDRELATRLGVTRQAVHNARKARGIARAPRRYEQIDWEKEPLGQMPDGILAERLDVHVKHVADARHRLKIPPFRGEDHAHNQEVLTRDALEDLYVRRELSAYAIAEMLDVCYQSVYNYLARYGIPFRKAGDAYSCDDAQLRFWAKMREQRHKARELDDPAWLRQQYEDRGWSLKQIAGRLGLDYRIVRRALIRHQIPIRLQREAVALANRRKTA